MNILQQEKIGSFIRALRKERGMTQKEFAHELSTSQSAVARMERGKQNFSTKELMKISTVLGHNIVTLNTERNDDFEINGGKKLHGSITTNTSKNGALGLMCAALLNTGTTTLHGIPQIEEIKRIIEIFESIGVKIEWIKSHSIKITPPRRFKLDNLDAQAAGRIRSVIMMIGALSHFHKDFMIPHAGGCKMGERTIAAHKHGLEKLGVKIKTLKDVYHIMVGRNRKPQDVTMYEASDTGTTNTLLAAALIPGKTVIDFAQQNYMVQDVCFLLEKLGIKIDGIGSKTLTVHGKKSIKKNIEHYNSEDPIESMMFISAAVTTKSELTIKRCPIEFLKIELLKLEKMGVKYTINKQYKSKNRRTTLVDITVYPSELTALPEKIHALPYPGINTDNLPFFVPVATQAKGTTMLHDWMWENRAVYFTELNRLGAKISLADPHRVFIEGPTKLSKAQIVCPPALRPSTMILVAMLAADGRSVLRNVYSINRGYENIVERLNSIGADIAMLRD